MIPSAFLPYAALGIVAVSTAYRLAEARKQTQSETIRGRNRRGARPRRQSRASMVRTHGPAPQPAHRSLVGGAWRPRPPRLGNETGGPEMSARFYTAAEAFDSSTFIRPFCHGAFERGRV